MEKFNLKKYVRSNINNLDWGLIDGVRIRGEYITNSNSIMYYRIESSFIIYDQTKRKLFITNGVSDGIISLYLEELYTIKLDRIIDFFFIRRLNRAKKNILDKEKQEEETKKMKSLPKSILREYKIDSISQEE